MKIELSYGRKIGSVKAAGFSTRIDQDDIIEMYSTNKDQEVDGIVTPLGMGYVDGDTFQFVKTEDSKDALDSDCDFVVVSVDSYATIDFRDSFEDRIIHEVSYDEPGGEHDRTIFYLSPSK